MDVALKPVKHSAQGPYLGFGLQPVRMCRHLLRCQTGAQVSLELLDDVAVHYPNGSVDVEQTKSATRKNPVSDWSIELWKTFSNWAEALAAGELIANKTRFTLYVTPQRTGEFVSALHAATTIEEVTAVLAYIKSKLARLREPRECDTYLNNFLNAPPEHQQTIISNFRFISDTDDPVAEIRELIAATVNPALWDDICAYGIGLAKERTDRRIRDKLAPILDGDRFKSDFRLFVQKTNTPALLTSFTTAPPPAELKAVVESRPAFIQQLELIGVENSEVVRAVSDYLRTSADKTTWAEAGLVFEESLSDWDEFLIARHGSIKGEVADLHGEKEANVRGRLLYRQCAKMEAALDGRSVPSHFVHGSFNDLANLLKLGWHPDYAALLGDTHHE
ncbi:hypothetical protein LQG66_30355 [Bradyrhizobium ontarionense]|uniref:ABC-three component systems C-terminal domain-containing protein n=1 Tax=Bradyrhizobium ontarionense TaxID=2898149 RepID=A0ABY3R9Q5_9BRAD|nr:ABC-three component system protein [Bradyrhizobium sp. A19]UFZ03483.1 hypothetical protein LQG66_30355 [Bradyrhizobium sp. A19]